MSERGKNWVATMMLCWALGGFGAHRFYTGKQTSAWVMAVMTITGILAPISALWALVDGFTIALGKFKAEDGSELEERIPWLGYTYIAIMILAIIGMILYSTLVVALLAAAVTSGAGAPVAP